LDQETSEDCPKDSEVRQEEAYVACYILKAREEV